MVDLSFMLLKNRKRFLATIIGVMTLASVLSLFSYAISTSNYNQKKELALNTYGSFVCGVCELSAEDDEKIEICKDIRSGHFKLYGEVKCADEYSFTIGSADEAFFEMANVEVIEGVMPVSENEIAVEQFAAELLGITGIDETITLKVNGIQKTAKVTGIVRNYSNQLNVYYRIKEGINDYPNIFCTTDFFQKSDNITPHYSALLGYENEKDIKSNQITTLNHMYAKIEKIGLSSGNVFDNDNLYIKGMQFCDTINRFSSLFLFVVVVTSIVCVLLLYRVFYKDYGKKIAVFKVCGLKKKQARYIFAIQLSFFALVSFALSGLVYVLLTYVFLHFTEHLSITIFSVKYLVFLSVWYFIVIGCTTIAIYVTTLSSCQKIYANVSGITDGGRMSNNVGKYPESTNIIEKISSINFESVVLNVLLFILIVVSLYSYHVTYSDYMDSPDYEMYAKDIVETECVKGYEVEYTTDRYIPKRVMESFDQYGERIFLDTCVNVNSNTLLLTEEQTCQYFEEWIYEYAPAETSYEDSIILDHWPSEANNYIPVPNVEITAITKEQFQEVCDQYQLESSDFNGVILFLPDASDRSISQRLGNHISIGGLNLVDNKVLFDKIDLPVNGVVFSDYQMEYGEYHQQRSAITIVMSEEKLAHLEFIKGFKEIRIFSDDLSQSEEKEINWY